MKRATRAPARAACFVRVSKGAAIVFAQALFVTSAFSQEPAVIIAGRYLAPDGTLKTNAAIVLSDGKIEAVRPASDYAETGKTPPHGRPQIGTAALESRGGAAAGPAVVRYPEAVVCPGLIDVRSTLGTRGRNAETKNAIDPGASAVDLVDFHHRDFRSAVRAGITTVLIAPADNNLVSGAAVVVKTAPVGGEASGRGNPNAAARRARRILRDDGPLMFALGSMVWQQDRAPTSRLGSVAMLREALEHARQGHGHERLAAMTKGTLDAHVVCEEVMDVDAALRLFDGYGRSVTFVHSSDSHALAGALASQRRAIVIGPYDFSMPARELSAASAFASADVPVAFAGGLPAHAAEALRITAALAVRYGMDPAKARRAITSVPATVAGVDDRVGSIRKGLDADLVVFSGDPLRLDARVLAVYVSGRRVYSAAQAGEAIAVGSSMEGAGP